MHFEKLEYPIPLFGVSKDENTKENYKINLKYSIGVELISTTVS
jgi:hypothetical protein